LPLSGLTNRPLANNPKDRIVEVQQNVDHRDNNHKFDEHNPFLIVYSEVSIPDYFLLFLSVTIKKEGLPPLFLLFYRGI